MALPAPSAEITNRLLLTASVAMKFMRADRVRLPTRSEWLGRHYASRNHCANAPARHRHRPEKLRTGIRNSAT